jgi:hypothetical protein
MYPINKYLYECVFEKNNGMYQDFMCSIDTEYVDTINILKYANTVPEIRKNVHKLVSIVSNLVDKNYEIIYYCKLVLLINKAETNVKWYNEYIKMILAYDKTKMGLSHL